MSPLTVADARFEFAPGTGNSQSPGVPVLAGEARETLFPGAVPAGYDGRFQLSRDGDFWLGLATTPCGADLGAAVDGLYAEMLGVFRHRDLFAVRIWNYIPAINQPGDEGLENYRIFCRERSKAFARHGLDRPPAASAVGCGADSLVLLFAATAGAPRAFENPEQVPAYEYPIEHGPRSPNFSRASQIEVGGQQYTFISGTASIKGHKTIEPDSLSGQIDCTLDNLRLISLACGLGPSLAAGSAHQRHFKVYLRHLADFSATHAALSSRIFLPTDCVTWLHSDICREALKLEIEATIVGPVGT